MSYENAAERLTQELKTIWEPTGYPYTIENNPFTPPGDKPWCRMSIIESTSDQVTTGSIGNRRFNYTGTIVVEIYTSESEGTRESNRLVDIVTNNLSQRRIPESGIILLGTIKRVFGVTGDGEFRVDVDISYTREDIR